MPTLTNILARTNNLKAADREWLHQLVGDWQSIADVAFADLLLIVQNAEGQFLIAAHCRPATAVTFFDEDIVGEIDNDDLIRLAPLTLEDGKRRSLELSGLFADIYPVHHEGRNIAILGVASAYAADRVPSQVLSNYEEVADGLLRMVATGEFPYDGKPTGFRHGTPRVSDGFVQLNEDGEVIYAAPNAISNFRRLGIMGSLSGKVLAELVTETIENHTSFDESLAVVVMGRAPWLTELEAHGAIISLRALPLRENGKRRGAMLLCRDITELRRREQELLSKDATIREINHRVKNNLQTVSALLRMQARRAKNEDTKQALDNAQRRVATIALVHQILSQNVDEYSQFDDVFGPLINMASDIAATGVEVRTQVLGSFGRIGANQTTALAMVLNELVSNAIEHGLPMGGNLSVTVQRDGHKMVIFVDDDGIGIVDGRPGSGLGTQIVRTMVAAELHGTIEWLAREEGGTRVQLNLYIDD